MPQNLIDDKSTLVHVMAINMLCVSEMQISKYAYFILCKNK